IAVTYPAEHAQLAGDIVRGGGALASERLPADSVTRWALVQRDRLQAAHARAVVLVESDLDGGAMHTMRFARELGRRRFAVASPASGNASELAGGAVALPWNVDAALERVAAAQ
ncbi:MAG: DNA-processing protein DprA, partial [Candidatus Velthaea sp.]